jgi:uncharacterized membrane protein YdjX (TVP38/TMEM64 family)
MDSDDSPRRRPSRAHRWWLIIAPLAAGLAIWGLASATELGTYLLQAWRAHRPYLLGLAQDYPLAASLAVFVLHTLLAALALPGASLVMLAAGAAYGAWTGTLLCLTACTVGASLSMLAARYFLRPFARRRLAGRLAALDGRIGADGAAYLFSLRLLPVIPFALVNVAAGLSTMRVWTFTWVSFVGMLAGTFLYVNAGTALAEVEVASDLYSPGVLVSVAALALIPWLAKFGRRAWQSPAVRL